MHRAFLTVSYLAAHLATGTACFGLVVGVPLLFMLGLALWSDDPGGPLFWPVFLLMLAALGLGVASVLSVLVMFADLLRLRWQVPVWVPPLAVWIVSSLFFVRGGRWEVCLLTGAVCCPIFSLYWLAVSSARFLPRLLVRVLRSR